MGRCAAWLSILLLGLGLGAADATRSPAQAQESFYNGKTVRIIVGFPPGGGFDIYARAIAREMGKHIPGAPAIIVQNMPGAASLNSIKYMDIGAPFDGTAINTFNSGVILDSLTNPEKIGIKLTDYHFIGSAARDIPVCYAWHTAGITSRGGSSAQGPRRDAAVQYLHAGRLGHERRQADLNPNPRSSIGPP